jgi:hypothetical protein
MNIFSVSRHIARKVAAQLDLMERAPQEIVAAALAQRRGILVPITVAVDRQIRARPRD